MKNESKCPFCTRIVQCTVVTKYKGLRRHRIKQHHNLPKSKICAGSGFEITIQKDSDK